jgi:hypothetical protein
MAWSAAIEFSTLPAHFLLTADLLSKEGFPGRLRGGIRLFPTLARISPAEPAAHGRLDQNIQRMVRFGLAAEVEVAAVEISDTIDQLATDCRRTTGITSSANA